MSEPAHPHQRVPAGRDPDDADPRDRARPAPPSAATTRRWSTASPGRRSPTPSSRRWSTGWRPGSPRSGCSPGDVVALHSPNTVLYPVVFYAASRAGATVTTLSALTRRRTWPTSSTTARRRWWSPSARCCRCAVEAAGDRPVWTCDQVEGHRSVQELLAVDRPGAGRRRSTPAEDVAVLPYSSGTTSLPKGVMLTHAQHRREPRADRRAAHDGPGGPDHRRPAVLPHLRHDRADERARCGTARRSSCCRGSTWSSSSTSLEQHRITRAYVAPPVVLAHGQAPGVRGPRLLRADVHPVAPPRRWTPSWPRSPRERLGAEIGQAYGMTELSPGTHLVPDGHGARGRRPARVGKLVPVHRGAAGRRSRPARTSARARRARSGSAARSG